MKKIVFLLTCLLALSIFAGCNTATNLARDGETTVKIADAKYSVLGRVQTKINKSGISLPSIKIGKSDKVDGLLYYKLYDAAKQSYPSADDVLNITVDYEGTSFLIFYSGTYTITGLAVDYE